MAGGRGGEGGRESGGEGRQAGGRAGTIGSLKAVCKQQVESEPHCLIIERQNRTVGPAHAHGEGGKGTSRQEQRIYWLT
jgi:hypothetical protein